MKSGPLGPTSARRVRDPPVGRGLAAVPARVDGQEFACRTDGDHDVRVTTTGAAVVGEEPITARPSKSLLTRHQLA
jgi:hypothetical protein